MGFGTALTLGLFAALVAFLAGSIGHIARIGGAFLTPNATVLGEGQGPIPISDTIHCEDVHHYRPANLLFTACEDYKSTRFSWFPPLGNFLPTTTRGSIHVVDPKTMKSTRLAFTDFEGPFVTHGIDVIEDPEQHDAVYIFAVNHLPNPAYFEAGSPEGVPKARSQVELFHHVLESQTVQHVRSIYHPLVETPNDIYAVSPFSFYVTNDHFYREGFMRHVEDFWSSAKWSSVIHVQVADLSKEASVEASVALTGRWNNNGLCHGRSDGEIIVSSAVGAELYISSLRNHSIEIQTTLAFDTVTDNPSYYADPYCTDADDASGFVVAGISKAIHLAANAKDKNAKDPSQVWYARFQSATGVWEKRLLFEDDGERIRTASAAVLVPVEPRNGQKLAWLFVTGFMSEAMIAVQVEL